MQKLVNLEVTPAEILFSQPGEKVQLKAVAVWPDGTREDVTCLCRFTSNSDQVAKIDADGLVTATDPGDTHVVVSYDNAVIAVPVIRPVSQLTGDQLSDTFRRRRRSMNSSCRSSGSSASCRPTCAPTPSSSAASAST